MIQTGQGDAVVEDLPYRSRHRALPVETFDVDDLRSRAALDDRPVECLQFHLLLLCTGGSGHHLADFADVEIVPQRIIHLRPGQVHRWQVGGRYRARLVLFPSPRTTAAPTFEWFPGDDHRTTLDPDTETWRSIIRTIDELEYEQHRFDGSASAIATMAALLELLLCRLPPPRSGSERHPTPHPVYAEFRRAVEQRLGARPDAADIARGLGYSIRTVDRACHAAVGRSAKQILDQRLLLEAQRLLAHTDDTMMQISHRLGFTEPTNFTKFVKRTCAMTPSELRSTVRAPANRSARAQRSSR